jgi:hypothetical protein
MVVRVALVLPLVAILGGCKGEAEVDKRSSARTTDGKQRQVDPSERVRTRQRSWAFVLLAFDIVIHSCHYAMLVVVHSAFEMLDDVRGQSRTLRHHYRRRRAARSEKGGIVVIPANMPHQFVNRHSRESQINSDECPKG